MPEYKLTYFDFRGLGEPIRFLLAYLGEKYEDNRIPYSQWETYKSKTPFGKVPVFEVDGKPLVQSASITRWLGKKANIAGKNDWESLQIDIAIDTFSDMRLALAMAAFEPNPEEKAKKMDVLLKDTLPGYLSKFDKMVKDNGGYMANGSLSWADMYFAASIDTLLTMLKEPNLLDKYSNLKALKEKVENIPQIKAWIAKRPVTDM